MAKLTLNADREVIEQAKRLAAERNTSVSALFSRFIRVLADGKDRHKPLGKLTCRASGVIDLKTKRSWRTHSRISTDYEQEYLHRYERAHRRIGEV
jgi:hypothetical protein